MRGHSLAIANHSTSHLAWQLTGWSPRQHPQLNEPDTGYSTGDPAQ
jgi:hypothetical protein